MKYDTIIIGGGLSGLVSGICCQKSGRKTAIISAGQSALHFWSGSFELLCRKGDREVIDRPLSLVGSLSGQHPYRKLGAERTTALLSRVAPLLAEAGINVAGSLERNHYRLTPLGFLKPAWLTLDDYFMLSDPEELKGKRYAIVNILSYLDFYPRFQAYGLGEHGAGTVTADVNIPELDILRKSTTQMRATNISRFLTDAAVDRLAKAVNDASKGTDAVIMPAVLGMFSDGPVRRLRSQVERPVYFVATTPASVPGVRCQLALRDYFIRLGGTFMPGDTVVKGERERHRLRRVFTTNFGDMPLEADSFVISTGSFFGHGLVATLESIHEPALGLDLYAPEGREKWYDKDFYAAQPYMGYGVTTDADFRPAVKGETIENLYATGALLAGFNALKEGSGAGITLATALHAADKITSAL